MANIPGPTRRRKVQRLIKRDGLVCSLCKQPMNPAMARGNHRDAITLDHVIPISEGGDNHDGNLRLAHRRCNNARSSAPHPDVLGGKRVQP